MKKKILIIILVVSTLALHRVETKKDNAPETNQIRSNFTGANLKGANLTGVNLNGFIFYNTKIPDKTINNYDFEN